MFNEHDVPPSRPRAHTVTRITQTLSIFTVASRLTGKAPDTVFIFVHFYQMIERSARRKSAMTFSLLGALRVFIDLKRDISARYRLYRIAKFATMLTTLPRKLPPRAYMYVRDLTVV
jgi:hypothetical protein